MKKDEASNEITEKKRKRGCTGRFLAFLFTFLIGVAVGLGASYYILVQQQSDSDAEQRAYAALENSTESRDYKNFLERFPSSGYASDVKSRMEKLQQMEAEWSRISTSKKVADFEAFRKQFQHPYYDKLCAVKIDSLDWAKALADSTREAFDHYMAIHPDGLFYAEATFAARQAERHELSADEREMVTNTLDGFMSLLGRGDTETLIGYLPDVMDCFLEKRMATRGDVVLMVEKMFGDNVRECTFSRSGDPEIKKRILAGQPAYSVTATYSGDIAVQTSDGKRQKTYVVRADLGEGHLVRAITFSTK